MSFGDLILTGIDDLFIVSSELLPVAHRWKSIGLALKLDPNLLERIKAKRNINVDENLSDTLTEWLQKAYNTTRFGDPSWKLLVKAVAHPAGGNNPALAQQIALKYNGRYHTLLYLVSLTNTAFLVLHMPFLKPYCIC